MCLLVTSVGRWVECWEGVGRLIRRVYRHEHEFERFAVGFGPHSVARSVGDDLPIRFYNLVNACEREQHEGCKSVSTCEHLLGRCQNYKYSLGLNPEPFTYFGMQHPR